MKIRALPLSRSPHRGHGRHDTHHAQRPDRKVRRPSLHIQRTIFRRETNAARSPRAANTFRALEIFPRTFFSRLTGGGVTFALSVARSSGGIGMYRYIGGAAGRIAVIRRFTLAQPLYTRASKRPEFTKAV